MPQIEQMQKANMEKAIEKKRRPTKSRKRNHRQGETAGTHLTASVPRAYSNETAAAVQTRLREHRFDHAELICITDPEDRLLGCVVLEDLIALPAETPMGDVLKALPMVRVDEDQEKLASLALHHRLTAVPVVDHGGHFLGVVPPLALMHILRHEHVEDLHRLAGIKRETHQAREAMESAPLRRARDRLPWLMLGLAGSALATQVVAQFEAQLQDRIAIAFFIPGLVYIADAIGTQTEAIAVRGLSLSHANLRSLLGGEMRTGLLIGLTLAAVTLPIIWLIFGDFYLALAVAVALFSAGCVATTIGLFLPWLLGELGTDPAYGSGPLATILQDVMSLLIYFAAVNLFLF
ncbi:magnesium transporter [Methylocaldum sp. RMAD-M]|jgi:magnesium transporter|uniref:magnesium transporter n=1 Tax=Methylocaldum sp. RMAD-M TaxID=2806557 RepID=UPI00197B1256|nr:magnesium transporter [Methylocaldum sp. RMAD-M]MBP1151448.1 magnesium transporter [Methylocaldum sp. RMAD-M]